MTILVGVSTFLNDAARVCSASQDHFSLRMPQFAQRSGANIYRQLALVPQYCNFGVDSLDVDENARFQPYAVERGVIFSYGKLVVSTRRVVCPGFWFQNLACDTLGSEMS
jgi:hypothetical protein